MNAVGNATVVGLSGCAPAHAIGDDPTDHANPAALAAYAPASATGADPRPVLRWRW